MQTIQKTLQSLHQSLKDYIEATYHIRSESLVEERRSLLDKPSIIFQEPYIESTPKYQTSKKFSEITGLAKPALTILELLSKEKEGLEKVIYDPPYNHQSESIARTVVENKNVVIMTRTGSGKTESFLMPIVSKLAIEAKESPNSYQHNAVRAILLYPMNALVNDQLGRLRTLFSDERLVEQFMSWGGRPPRFARYTSRTPYPGVRTNKKDGQKLKPIRNFYIDEIEQPIQDGDKQAEDLKCELKAKGKWPAKPDIVAWYGSGHWQKDGEYIRGVMRPEDSELITRHEVQVSPPDLLVTNYSMLEYMLMRPIERNIFDQTRLWLENNKNEKFIIILDEAHLYKGAQGTEVALLIRRLRSRLGIPAERLQVVCSTASFQDENYAPIFGAELTGCKKESFVAITGNLALRENTKKGKQSDIDILASIDLEKFQSSEKEDEKIQIISDFLVYRDTQSDGELEKLLFNALKDYAPMNLLVNESMKSALKISDLSKLVFDTATTNEKLDRAVTTLMTLGNLARQEKHLSSLFPSRIHNFFRGLVGLWVCMDPNCTEKETSDKICGKMYSQPRISGCKCGAKVLELYTCRNCGSAYARAYTDDLNTPTNLWAEPGHKIRIAGEEKEALEPIDLLLEVPADDDEEEQTEIADYDLETGRINPQKLSNRTRSIYLRHDRVANDENNNASGEFNPCGICKQRSRFGTSVQNHQTSGDEPFQALVSKQIEIQPPTKNATPFAPLAGRKVLAFSDSRQMAARLAPSLQTYSERDALRPLIVFGYHLLESKSHAALVSLEDLFPAVMIAANYLDVRLSPELEENERSFFLNAKNEINKHHDELKKKDEVVITRLNAYLGRANIPSSLFRNTIRALQDRHLGLEALAIASIVETKDLTSDLKSLPDIPGIAESNEQKVGFARAWLRYWFDQKLYGFQLNRIPVQQRTNEYIRTATGKWQTKINRILKEREQRRIFNREWLPRLLSMLALPVGQNKQRLSGDRLSLKFEGKWVRCNRCSSVHRPIPDYAACLDCGGLQIDPLEPETNEVFKARKGYYRNKVISVINDPPQSPITLIAAEHTAQLNSESDDVFSKVERNELLFQDIKVNLSNFEDSPAVDILSSTTTMEVGIDIGQLSGVALRNMPPARSNYQQRAGRAGRRGVAIATVIAFGSADSHDEHYFTKPDEMIRGDVTDPKLILQNENLTERHIRAYLLQRYHEDRISTVDENQNSDLFSVLGSVEDFRNDGAINYNDFKDWLNQNKTSLKTDVADWIPDETNKEKLIHHMIPDTLDKIREAIDAHQKTSNEGEDISTEIQPEQGNPRQQLDDTKLLGRLLHEAILPKYAFPTDVAAFRVFNIPDSTGFSKKYEYQPSYDLSIALSQYAPGRRVFIDGQCYFSKAIYSVGDNERTQAWRNRRLYHECTECGFAETIPTDGSVERGSLINCGACGGENTLGPAKYWFRPPGFAHRVGDRPETDPDEFPDISYATAAKLTMNSPDNWEYKFNNRIKVHTTREQLLVSNTGPEQEGYRYCTFCGCIEASTTNPSTLNEEHLKPYPDDKEQNCQGGGRSVSPSIVLGTEFISDLCLLSFTVDAPIRLRPTDTTTKIAMRTLCAALSTAACNLFEIERGEINAEYRPERSRPGRNGLVVEVFLYDTLSGGAGFSSQVISLIRDKDLFEEALKILKECPEDCDASCYRCLRSFKNKIHHTELDRHIGYSLLEYLLNKEDLSKFSNERLEASYSMLFQDLSSQLGDKIEFSRNRKTEIEDYGEVIAPILANVNNKSIIIDLCDPLTEEEPLNNEIKNAKEESAQIRFVPVNEIEVRYNLPAAIIHIEDKIMEIASD